MKRKLTKFFNLVKNSKEIKVMLIFNIVVVFILLLGNSLSVYTSNKNTNMANIKVNGLSFNMTTNSGTSDDRILHLQAGKIESFNIVLTNLNKTEVKYELIYDVCNDSKCTGVSKELPTGVYVYSESISNTKISGLLAYGNENKISIKIYTKNESEKDVYIKLNMNVGYSWNELELANQINEKYNTKEERNIISYVDGVKVESETPSNCGYTTKAKALKNGVMVETEDIELTCDYYKNKWSINFKDLMSIPDKIELYFTSTGVPADALIKNYEYIEPTTEYSEPYYTFTVPVDGTYKIETWGAQGGYGKTDGYRGGFGGYSMGIINLLSGQNLYIYVGGQGVTSTTYEAGKVFKGGYNGGGAGGSTGGKYGSGGGGATHIALQQGILSKLSGYKDSILIVSGGGGAGFNHKNDTYSTMGGSAGGMSGSGVNPGTQTSGGGTFGSGASSSTGSGGGGGFYGGGICADSKVCGGGSSYIGNSVLTDKAMYCYGCTESTDTETYTINTLGTNDTLDKINCPDGYSAEPISKCAKSGNGYARITFVNDAN